MKTRNKFLIAILVLIIGVIINQWVSIFLETKYGGSLPLLPDLILNNLPYLKVQWIYDLFPLMSILLFIIYVWKEDFKNAPYFILLFGILQLVRGVFIGLTPFGSPNLNEIGLFVGSSFRAGIYPSGHTGATFLAFLLSKGNWRKIFFSLFVLTIAFLFLGRGHYSIDILSAIIFVYAIKCFGDKYFRCFKNGVGWGMTPLHN